MSVNTAFNAVRVLKKEGIFVASYINKYAVILHDYEEEIKNMDELLIISRVWTHWFTVEIQQFAQ